jgi:hypothetical protein
MGKHSATGLKILGCGARAIAAIRAFHNAIKP